MQIEKLLIRFFKLLLWKGFISIFYLAFHPNKHDIGYFKEIQRSNDVFLVLSSLDKRPWISFKYIGLHYVLPQVAQHLPNATWISPKLPKTHQNVTLGYGLPYKVA